MGLEHLVKTLNRPSLRGAIAMAHVTQLATRFQHWPAESDTGIANLPTLRLLRCIHTIPGLELLTLPKLRNTNEIAATIREASLIVDQQRASTTEALRDIIDPKEYSKRRRQDCHPLRASTRILKSLSPLWESKLFRWSQILVKADTPDGPLIRACTVDSIIAQLPEGHAVKKSERAPRLHRALRILQSVLAKPSNTEHRKLPTPLDTTSEVEVHPSWRPHLPDIDQLPPQHTHGYNYMTRRASKATPSTTSHLKATHEHHHYLTQCEELDTPYDVLEIAAHASIAGQTRYLVSQWAWETLTRAQITSDSQEEAGFTVDLIQPIQSGTADPCFNVKWHSAWQSEATVLASETGPSAVKAYKISQRPPTKRRRTTPPAAPQLPAGWHPLHCTHNPFPINPDLDTRATGALCLSRHPRLMHMVILHKADGHAITTLEETRVTYLHRNFQPHLTNLPFEEALAKMIYKTDTAYSKQAALREIRLADSHQSNEPAPTATRTGQWPIPHQLYMSLDAAFGVDRVLHCNPMNVPLDAPAFFSEDPDDNIFSAELLTNTAWPGTSLSLPVHTADSLTRALERAIYSAHTLRHKTGCATLLLLPTWKHSPYLSRNLHNNGYVQRIATIPYAEPGLTPRKMPKYKLNLYLVANSKMLDTINTTAVQGTLRTTIENIYNEEIRVHITNTPSQETAIDSTTRYHPVQASSQPPDPETTAVPYKPPLTIRDFVPAWDYRSFVYTDGSKVTGKPTLGAAAVFPGDTEDEVIRIKVESEPERHTINRDELAAIAVSLKKKISQPDLRILTDSAFSIYTIRNFGTDPASYSNHLHVELLRYIDNIIRARDANGLHTHIGKVKSHIDIHYNEVADEAARSIATGDAEPDVTFSAADPPVGGLRTWPFLRECREDDEDVLTNLTDLKTDAKKNAQKATLVNLQPTTVFNRLLQRAKSQGADYSIHAYSKSTYKDRRNSLEVAWGVHRYRMHHKFGKNQPLVCDKCKQKLTNTHILGGCYTTSRLRISRHHSTFKLLVEHLQKSNGGRWPILSMDLGNGPVRDFEAQLQT